MIGRIQEFCALLRKNQVRVSTGEVVDAVFAAAAVGLADVADLRAALAATLAKRPCDRQAFDELFDLYFLRGAELARASGGAPLAALLQALGLGDDEIERVIAVIADRAARLGAVGRVALGLRGGEVLSLLRITGVALGGTRIVSPLHVGFHAHRVLEALDVPGAEREVGRLLDAVAAELGEGIVAAIRQAVADNIAGLRQAVRRHVQDEFEKQNRDFLERFRLESLSRRPFASLSEDEVRRLRREVARLAAKLRTQASLRPRAQRRGRLDVRRTLRRSLATGGVPVVLRHRRRRVERPRLVILCDISDSVRNVSRFMLELVYTLQELFARVRSYVFVSDLGEVTDLFRRCDIDRAVELAYHGAVVSVHANSNYGRALELFVGRHAEAVNGRTTVVVIGDARNNYNPPNADCLAELRRRAHRLLWVNPEPPGAWGLGDSAMLAYEPHCDRVVVAHDLDSLRQVVDELVL